MTTRSRIASHRSAGFLRARARTRSFAITRKKKLSSRNIGAISPRRERRGRRGRRDGAVESERRFYLDVVIHTGFSAGDQGGARAISCQSAWPVYKGGPFIRNRLKAQINKPCRWRFILHITQPRLDEARREHGRFPVIIVTKPRERLTRVIPRFPLHRAYRYT